MRRSQRLYSSRLTLHTGAISGSFLFSETPSGYSSTRRLLSMKETVSLTSSSAAVSSWSPGARDTSSTAWCDSVDRHLTSPADGGGFITDVVLDLIGARPVNTGLCAQGVDFGSQLTAQLRPICSP